MVFHVDMLPVGKLVLVWEWCLKGILPKLRLPGGEALKHLEIVANKTELSRQKKGRDTESQCSRY